jgi:hypothetical protein
MVSSIYIFKISAQFGSFNPRRAFVGPIIMFLTQLAKQTCSLMLFIGGDTQFSICVMNEKPVQ